VAPGEPGKASSTGTGTGSGLEGVEASMVDSERAAADDVAEGRSETLRKGTSGEAVATVAARWREDVDESDSEEESRERGANDVVEDDDDDDVDDGVDDSADEAGLVKAANEGAEVEETSTGPPPPLFRCSFPPFSARTDSRPQHPHTHTHMNRIGCAVMRVRVEGGAYGECPLRSAGRPARR
jgi:hypothetical protein